MMDAPCDAAAPMPMPRKMMMKMNVLGAAPPPPAASIASGGSGPVRFARKAMKMAAVDDAFDGGYTGGSSVRQMKEVEECEMECDEFEDAIADLCEEPECAVEEICEGAAPPRDDDDDVDEVEPDEDNANGGDGSNGDEAEGDNELNQEQINDAFDVFF